MKVLLGDVATIDFINLDEHPLQSFFYIWSRSFQFYFSKHFIGSAEAWLAYCHNNCLGLHANGKLIMIKLGFWTQAMFPLAIVDFLDELSLDLKLSVSKSHTF